MLFILGFILLLIGFAMVVVGPIPFSKNWTLSGGLSRTAGLFFLSFFPLFFGVKYAIQDLGWEEGWEREAINWGTFAFCALSGCFLIFYVGRPAKARRARRPASVSAENPLAAMEEPPAKPSAAEKPRGRAPSPPAKKRAPQPEQNPFDFS
jgi:hypothetical protein